MVARMARRHRSRMAGGALLGWGSISLLSGFLTMLRAPSMFFLKLKIFATEYGYVLAALYLVSFPIARLAGLPVGARAVSTACVLAGGALTALPVARAAALAERLPRRLSEAFGEPTGQTPGAMPFLFRRLVFLWPASARKAERVVFAEAPDYQLEFDLYRPHCPSPPERFACVVVVHGGRWTEGDSREFAGLNPYLANRGYVVVSINYRKADHYPFPAARDDLRSALDYIKRNAKSLRVDPERIVLLGRSAGGQLALLVAYESKDPAVRGVISFYGPTDMRYGYQDPTNPRVIDHEATLELYLGGNPHAVGEVYDAASPIGFAATSSPPTLLLHGTHDEMVHVAQSDRLAERLREVGARHLFLRLPWATHGFDHNLNGPGGQISTYAVEGFLNRVLG